MLFIDVILRRYLLHSLIAFEAKILRGGWRNCFPLFDYVCPKYIDLYSEHALAPIDVLDQMVMSPHTIQKLVENSEQMRTDGGPNGRVYEEDDAQMV